MKLSINGDWREDLRASTVEELIVELGLPAPAMLVEHNGVALRRGEWEACVLREEDRLEIIRIVAGG
jgi:thiamine biosynthesis protein ThiS